jgi:hypothetical protein
MALDQNDYTELNKGEGGDKMATSTDGELKAQKVQPVFGLDAGGLLAVDESNPLPVVDPAFVEIDGTVGQNIDDEFVFTNPCSFASIGFHFVAPPGGKVVFEGTFDGTNWVPITYRSMGIDEFVNHAHYDEDFVGSIANLRQIRFRTTVAGSGDGSVHGRVIRNVHTLESIEHGNPPHKIGQKIIRFGVDVTAPVTGSELFVPYNVPHDRRFVITGYQLSLSGTGEITIFDETDISDNWIFAASVKINAAESDFISHTFSVPFVSTTSGNRVLVTATGTAVAKGVFTGYELLH